ncbi:hypothetical protein RJT34_05661 [Clitoria ternatea]|uniref:Protein kinase domain-containing protein n=1 Tax=Clitoria ternatea TaxID=43366 RepID=A0AAN9K2X2_CLITE
MAFRILLCGNVLGRLHQLFKHVSSVKKSVGPFDALLWWVYRRSWLAKPKFIWHLKLENVLLDAKGNIKITDFNLNALAQYFRADGLLHTTCGSPNYVCPEILVNRGYDGETSDIWSCGVVLSLKIMACLL